jgi:non-heme chloroperoxidase
MLFFFNKGFRVIAHDRRGHGRSTQTGDGHDMDHYADDLAALTTHVDLKDAEHVGHSTGGGEVVHYTARHGESMAKTVLIAAVPPLMVKTAANPSGLSKEVFDRLQALTLPAAGGSITMWWLARSMASTGPPQKVSQAAIWNWWRQGMMGGAKVHYDGIVVFSQTDFTEDLKKIYVPVLVMHSEDDQIVPYADSAPLSAKLLKPTRAFRTACLLPRHPSLHSLKVVKLAASSRAFARSARRESIGSMPPELSTGFQKLHA